MSEINPKTDHIQFTPKELVIKYLPYLPWLILSLAVALSLAFLVNASILVLRQIAEALGVTTASLLGSVAESGADDPRRKRIALIGLRGAGKSTVGKVLAEELGVPFFELDRLVCSHH